jgi:hypothetical protein
MHLTFILRIIKRPISDVASENLKTFSTFQVNLNQLQAFVTFRNLLQVMKFSAITLAALNFLQITNATPAHRPIKYKVETLVKEIGLYPTTFLSPEFNQRYRINQVIGHGDFGVVVSALRVADNKDVAIKIGYPSKENNMKKEAAILTYAQQKNVPNMLGFNFSGRDANVIECDCV